MSLQGPFDALVRIESDPGFTSLIPETIGQYRHVPDGPVFAEDPAELLIGYGTESPDVDSQLVRLRTDGRHLLESLQSIRIPRIMIHFSTILEYKPGRILLESHAEGRPSNDLSIHLFDGPVGLLRRIILYRNYSVVLVEIIPKCGVFDPSIAVKMPMNVIRSPTAGNVLHKDDRIPERAAILLILGRVTNIPLRNHY